MRFVHDTLPQRVSFGSGEAAASLEREVAELGASRVMVIASKREMDTAGTLTGNLRVLLRYDDVVMHVPVEVAARGREAAATHNVDAIVSVGGGSTTGLAKAIALTTGLPVVAVPTTYAGSEATAVWGLTEGNRKTTGTDPRVLPKVIVYDATLTLTLPVPISVASGLNALAHCVDAMWAPKADPINAALAAEGIRALADGPAEGRHRPFRHRRPRARPLRRVPVGRGVRVGGLGPAPQDLPCARRRLQPAARPDARHRAAVRARLQRARGTGQPSTGSPPRSAPTGRSTGWKTCAASSARRTRCATTASPRTRSPRRPRRSCPPSRRATPAR